MKIGQFLKFLDVQSSMSSSDLGVSCDKLCLVIRVVVHKRKILSKVGWNMSSGYGAPGRKTEEEKKKEKKKKEIAQT